MGNNQTPAKQKNSTKMLSTYCCETNLIHIEMKTVWQQQVAQLETTLKNHKDWNPYSSEQTWNLVNPSLYCFIKGVTPCTNSSIHQRNQTMTNWIGIGDAINIPTSWEHESKFQWLPSEFKVDENGKVTIQSYINNLHPYHFRNLYKSIANIFQRFIPQFETCLKKNHNKTNLKGKNLQVIVKLAENVLTPQKPYYDSGMMHKVFHF